VAQVAVITAASAGVGRACGPAFAERGYDLGSAAVEQAAERVEQALGPIDVLGQERDSVGLRTVSRDDGRGVRAVMAVTFLGQVNDTRAALRRMVGAEPRQHRGGGVGAGLPRHPVAVDIQSDKMRRKPQPVPPIFQPEVATKAVGFAAESKKREEVWVGVPWVRAILANRLFPGVLDRLLMQRRSCVGTVSGPPVRLRWPFGTIGTVLPARHVPFVPNHGDVGPIAWTLTSDESRISLGVGRAPGRSPAPIFPSHGGRNAPWVADYEELREQAARPHALSTARQAAARGGRPRIAGPGRGTDAIM
jgi:hypothetical protein